MDSDLKLTPEACWQYRIHPAICKVVGSRFYTGKLAADVARLVLIHPLPETGQPSSQTASDQGVCAGRQPPPCPSRNPCPTPDPVYQFAVCRTVFVYQFAGPNLTPKPREQYRMHPAICKVVGARFYEVAPYTPHPAPYTLNLTPYTLHPTPYTLHPTPYTLHPPPATRHPAPYLLHHKL